MDNWTSCPDCQGRGKKAKRLRKKVRLAYQRAVQQFEQEGCVGAVPVRPKGHLDPCVNCNGSGLVASPSPVLPNDEYFPKLAIIGGGIGGVALAVACLHRGIPFTLYERDESFDARSQGYGLTLQQASRAVDGLGLFSLTEGVVSNRHLVHTPEGKIVGEWGVRKLGKIDNSKRGNIHIARQSLRAALLEQLGGHDKVQWGHQLVGIEEHKAGVYLRFKVNGETQTAHADMLVGADGIRSTVRSLLLGEEIYPLRYLDCIVILGICPLADIEKIGSDLLDSETVFQTANGHERIYVMPYDTDSVMWQLSFPLPEQAAKALSAKGAAALKQEALKRCQWHKPIPQILSATKEALVSGYPVYDRALLQPENLHKLSRTTLMGDAAHPMSPFKGQGANQALLDALALARKITQECRPQSDWRQVGLRGSVLSDFESAMLERSAVKVEDSAAAAQFLHSDIALHESDEPRGSSLKKSVENQK